VLNPKVFARLDELAAQKGDKFSLIDLYLSIVDKEVVRAYIPADYRMMDVGKIDQISEAEAFAQSL
jgi:UTP-glucose-1-phosphate uridylyltransferase